MQQLHEDGGKKNECMLSYLLGVQSADSKLICHISVAILLHEKKVLKKFNLQLHT